MTTQQWVYIIGFAIALTAIIKVLPIIIKSSRNKKVEDGDKDKLQEIAIMTIKKLLQLSTVTTEEDVKNQCLEEIKEELKVQKITEFTDKDIMVAIDLAFKIIDNKTKK